MTLVEIEVKIIEWAKARGIIPNGNTITQAIKTLEEVQELLRAIDRNDKLEISDAYGDIFVTIVIGAYLNGGSITLYANDAYNVIKDRTGTLLPNGDFVKDTVGSTNNKKDPKCISLERRPPDGFRWDVFFDNGSKEIVVFNSQFITMYPEGPIGMTKQFILENN